MATIRDHIDRINSEIPIVRVLADLGYGVRPDGAHREQQFSCDLHGDGRDGKPSARVYPDSASWYCFACSKSRDAVETMRAKFGLDFMQAVRALEERYGLPDLPWDDERPPEAPDSIKGSVRHLLDTTKTFEEDLKTIRSSLEWATQERSLPMNVTLTFWEAVDQVAYKVEAEKMTEDVGRQVLFVLQGRVDKALEGG